MVQRAVIKCDRGSMDNSGQYYGCLNIVDDQQKEVGFTLHRGLGEEF